MIHVLIFCILLLITFPCLGQRSPDTATRPGEHTPLKWDWRRSEELGWKQSISRRKNLVSAERERLLIVIIGELRRFAEPLQIESEEELRRAAADTRIKYIDLSGDGRPEVVAQAGGEKSGCSPTGNCPFWILHRHGDKYQVLLEAEAQTFTVQPGRSKGFSDIVLTRHGSAYDSEVKAYKFNGETYAETGCYNAEWEILGRDEKYHKLKEPQITSCGSASASEQ